MTPRLLLDTHVLVRWLVEPRRLSREQARVLDSAERRSEPLAISTITIWEVAQLALAPSGRIASGIDEVLQVIENEPSIRRYPIGVEAAREALAMKTILRDPADCIIVATARVHKLRLLTSDERIIGANLVSTID